MFTIWHSNQRSPICSNHLEKADMIKILIQSGRDFCRFCAYSLFLLMLAVGAEFFTATFAHAGVETSADTNSIFHESATQRDARMKWWRDARFGLFIHWGLYSVPAGEWQGKTNCGERTLEIEWFERKEQL